MRLRALWLAFALLASPAFAAARFALVMGNDEGEPSRPKLWFAERDAERFARTLRELGDFPRENIRLLRGRSAAEAREQLRLLEAQVAQAKQAGQHTLLVVYFSGHAEADGVELGSDRLPFRELREVMERSAADVRVAIVDACESGSLTQVKGARAAPELDFALPEDDSTEGVAYLASTAVGEAAQESGALGGSFFTYHLEAALRGAGDADGDGQVTLAEAFRYTSARTVTGTAATVTGAQHPTYQFRMSGRGDVVLSTLRRAEARLLLPEAPPASYVVSSESGVVAEVPAGVALALPAGRYHVERRWGRNRAGGDVTLAKGDALPVPQLVEGPPVTAQAKGGERTSAVLFAGAGGATARLPGSAGGLGLGLGARWPAGPFALRLRGGYDLALGDDRGLRYQLHSAVLAGAALYPLSRGALGVDLGLELGGGYDEQQLEGGKRAGAFEALGGAALAADLPVGPVRLGVQLNAGARALPLDGRWQVQPRLEAALVVGKGI